MRTFIAVLILCMTLNAVSTSAQRKSSKNDKSSETPKNTMPAPKTKPTKAPVNYSVNWGPDVKLKGFTPDEILLYKNGSFYVEVGHFMSRFNKNMELELQKKIETVESSKEMSEHRCVGIREFNDAIYLITREKDKKQKRVLYFMENLDLSTLEPQGNKKQVYEISYAEKENRKRDDTYVGFLISKDKKNIIMYEDLPVEKEQPVRIIVSALDKNLNSTWRKEVELPVSAGKGRYVNFRKYLDNVPNLYMIAKVYNDDGKKKKKDIVEGELNYDYHIYTIGKDISTYVDYPFNLKDKAVSQIELDVNEKGEMIACGLYADINTEKNRITGPKGVFYTTIDPANKSIKAQSYRKFDTDVFTAGLSAKKAAKKEEKMEEGKDGDATGFIIDDIIPRKDGGSTLIAEEAYTYTVTYRCGNSYCTVTHYVYNNIIVAKINAAGEIEWTTVIPKRQDYVKYRRVGSYLVFDQGNDTYDFYFNDDKDNLNDLRMETKGADVASDRLKNLRFVRQVISADGTLSKREIAFKMDEDDEDTHFCPTVSKIVSGNEIILYGIERRKDKFAKITYRGLEVAE